MAKIQYSLYAQALSLRILVADDNPDDVWLLYEALRVETAVELVVAPDGAEALRAMTGRQFDLVILDLNLPLLNAFEIVAQPQIPSCPIIVLSSQVPEHARTSLLAGNVKAVLEKPMDWEGLRHLASLLLSFVPPKGDLQN